MGIQITARDARATVIMPPSWYIVEVSEVNTKAAKTDGSTNYLYRLKVISDLKGSEDFADCRVKDFLISEKGVFGAGIAFFAAIDPAVKEAIEELKKGKNKDAPPINIDYNAPVGKKLRAKVENTVFEGKTSNEATDFLPI